MIHKIKHPRLKTDNNLIIESLKKSLEKLLGLKTSIESTSNNSIKISFNRKLGESTVKNDFLKKEIHRVLYEEFGLEPLISKYKDTYDVLLDADSVYLENKVDDTHLKADSNVVLDNRFIWLFNILDKNYNILVEEIDTLDDAIELAVNTRETKFIVANPYIDPDPDNKAVELVFADNPGPIIIYDGTQTNDFDKEELEEEIIEETTQVDSIGSKTSYKLSNKELKALDNPLYKDWWIARDKDSDLMLFKSKPIRSTIDLSNVGENVRWLPQLDESYDYRDFNKHKELFEFITWDNGPIQVKTILEDENQLRRSFLSNYSGEEKVFRAIELLSRYGSSGESTTLLSNEFKKTAVDIIGLGNEFIQNVLKGYEAIIGQLQQKNKDKKIDSLEKALKLSLKKFNYVLKVVQQTTSTKDNDEAESISLRSLATDAGLLPTQQATQPEQPAQQSTEEVLDNV